MFTDILSLQYDSHHPDYSLTLVNSLRSYINLKLDHEKKTPEFITEIQRRLYFIHEYNCQVAKVTQKYPQSRQFELLLIKYVELEYDALYSGNFYPSQEIEVAAELRILRLLQVMLYSAVHNNEPLVNKHTDRAVKKAVLQLLGEVKPTYLVKNKLICNIANKLLKKIHGNSKKFHCKQSSVREIHRNLATSDYGSEDSDSDFESNIFSTKLFINGNSSSSQGKSTTSECVEVPLTTNGLAPIPTIEFTDDDDNYFVYLQKRVSTKRKIQDDSRTVCNKKNVSEIASNNLSNRNALELLINSDSKENTKSDKNCVNKLNNVTEKSQNHGDASCVIVCSDSEDEVCEVTLNSGDISNKVSSRSNDRVPASKKNDGVVTFEILDDDDDDETNYMVYLQKEVETNKRPKNIKEAGIEEILICSDTEDESSSEKTKDGASTLKCSKDSDGGVTCLQKSSSTLNQKVPFTQAEPDCTLKQSVTHLLQNSSTNSKHSNDHLQEHEVRTVFPNDNLNKVTNDKRKLELTDNEINFKNNEGKKRISSEKTIDEGATSFKHVDMNYLIFNDEVGATTNKSSNGDFLVHPASIFEQMSVTNLQKRDQMLEVCTEVEIQADVPGGPVMNEKVGSFEDVGNVSECRINESLLEEILLDDTYLLEGRKEFEELEYFLFNDNTDRQGFSLSNFSFDESEVVSQPETFDADIKSLESFLDDSQLICVNSKASTSLDSSGDLSQNSGHTKHINGKKSCNILNNENCESKRRKSPCSSRNYSRAVFKHAREINR